MAFSGEAEALTWQRVKIATANSNPHVQNAFRMLRNYLVQMKGNPNLQFVAFDKTTNGSDGTNADSVICGGACRVVALYGKKSTGTTKAYLTIANHATTIQATKEILLQATEAAVPVYAVYPDGLALSTGATLAAVTAYDGTTHSLIIDSFDGFALIASS